MDHQEIKLLATDFDGTIFRYGNESHLYASFANQVNTLQAAGARWLVCSGRTLYNLRSASRRLLRQNIKPDFILVRHSIIMTEAGGIWIPHLPLTLTALFLRRNEVNRLRSMTTRIVRELHTALHRCRIVYVERFHLRIQCRHDEDVETALRLISEVKGANPFVTVMHSNREIEVCCLPLSKAAAVTAIRNHLGLKPENVLTIGDGRSDLGMMVASVAGMVGCPSNARRDTIQFVLERGGHIAQRESLGGTIDVIDAYIKQTVSSVPPRGWRPPSDSLGIPDASIPRTTRHREKALEIGILIGAAVVGVLALASFGILPFGDLLLKPVIYLLHGLLELFV